MNFSSIIGLIMAIVVVAWSAGTATPQWKVFLDLHAFVIVIVGTIAAALLSFSGKKLYILLRVFFTRVLGKNDELGIAMTEIIGLAKGQKENASHLKDNVKKIKTPFLQEAIQLMIDGGIEPQELFKILQKRASVIHQRHEEDAEVFKALAKFPPAFGLLGAVMGMIAMMQSLGGADAMAKVGPALAVALVATLYGIALANFIFLPLGENVAKLNRMDNLMRMMIIDGVKMLYLKKHPLIVEETLRSFLIPSERKNKKPIKAA